MMTTLDNTISSQPIYPDLVHVHQAYGWRYYIILRLLVKWIHDRLTLRLYTLVDGTTTYKRSRIDNNKEIITRDLARAVYSLSGVFSRQVRVWYKSAIMTIESLLRLKRKGRLFHNLVLISSTSSFKEVAQRSHIPQSLLIVLESLLKGDNDPSKSCLSE